LICSPTHPRSRQVATTRTPAAAHILNPMDRLATADRLRGFTSVPLCRVLQTRFMRFSTLLALLLGAVGVCGSRLHPTCSAVVAGCPVPEHRIVQRLRGGADELDSELEAEDDGDDLDVTADGAESDAVAAGGAGLENPFLDAAGAGGAGGLGLGLQDLASTLQDPKILQDALRELQDPATQSRVKAMMEDPAFQDSMKQYMEQMMKDPQFETLKEQAEQMMQQEGFMEQMSQAFADLGGALGEPPNSDKSK